MLRSKIVKAARVQKLYWFASKKDFNNHIKFLKSRRREYWVECADNYEDGSVTVLISEQYNGNELLK